MRIGCLQFAPQVGDIDNNLNRADAVLHKANPENLDLLVLPELAFTGYNFESLQQISPFLEHKGSGLSAIWARTVALKLGCLVSVGYPETVDVAPKWPTSPEYYNSVIIVDKDGETIANYRKTFLYYTDETWALEGEGFFGYHIPELDKIATMGICMDINPRKFEAPWHAFEFAFHCLEVEANVVIMTMAWVTREDARHFSRTPNEPDMETLTYWISRLEPIIRSGNQEEIIVIFCNRCGIEGDVVYAGTSAVIGIKDGEVRVYGILGRGEKALLVVDTEKPPYAKLVYRPEENSPVASDLDYASSTMETEHTDSYETVTATPPSVQVSPEGRSEGASEVNAFESEALLEKAAPINLPDSPVSEDSYQTDPVRRDKAQAPPIQIPQLPAKADTIPTPAMAFDDTTADSPNRFFRIASDSLLSAPLQPAHARADSPTLCTNTHTTSQTYAKTTTEVENWQIEPQSIDQESGTLGKSGTSSKSLVQATDSHPTSKQPVESEQSPSAPLRNAVRPKHSDRSDSPFANRPDWAAIAERLDALSPRPDSAAANKTESFPSQPGSIVARRRGTSEDWSKTTPSRPSSPKSRNASVSRAGDLDHQLDSRRKEGFSRASMSNIDPASDHASRLEEVGIGRPQSRAQSRGRKRAL